MRKLSFALVPFVLVPFTLGTLVGCNRGPALRGQIAGLRQLTEQAERNGAVRCAPRELAMAQSNLRFAEIELDQGSTFKAEDHLAIAEVNARSANDLSPAEYCTERRIVEVKPLPKPGDRDGDGYLDPDDKCADQPENYNGFEDLDGCPDDPDTDGDGLLDSVDACVMEPEDVDQYLDNDGCPEVDNDGDTVPDLTDQCPNTPGQKDQDPLGCPTKPALVVVTDCEVKITQQIHFEFNKDKIRPESFPVLDAVVEVLQKNATIKLEVQGHTDDKGSPKYNKDLSNRRAGSVMKYLVSHGVPADRLTSAGYGLERPLVPNTSDTNRALNRRVQFVRTEGAKEGCPGTGSSQ
jgi:OmpA-OmpF porin, OOP family